LRFYWTVRGHLLEGAGVLAGFLDASDARDFSDLRVSALTAAGDLLSDLGVEGASRTRYEEALTLARSRDDDLLAADAIRGLAWASLEHDPPAAALALIDDGLARARAVADRNLEAVLLGQRAFALHYLGDTEGARGEFAAALAIARAIGDHSVTSLTLNNLAEFELEAGDLEASRQRYNEAVVIARDLGSESSISHGLCGLAAICILGARYVEANQLLAESLVLADRLREQSMVREVFFWLALVASRTGDAERAAQLHGAANPRSEDRGLPFQSGFRSSLRQADYAELRTAVGDDEFEAAYAAGQALTRSEAMAIALRS
jgi:tetratricopeptide (TPR) repeat protein